MKAAAVNMMFQDQDLVVSPTDQTTRLKKVHKPAILKKFRIQITPQTHVRSNQSDKIFFRIPEDQLREQGLKRKLRLENYNTYKQMLVMAAFEARFDLMKEYKRTPPGYYMHLIFYIPCSPSWRKWQKIQQHGQIHHNKPDGDNLLKAFKDALTKNDEVIGDIRITKYWNNSEEGFIDVIFRKDDLM